MGWVLSLLLRALIRALHADRNPVHQEENYHQFESELLE
jgi:hypothetical protein